MQACVWVCVLSCTLLLSFCLHFCDWIINTWQMMAILNGTFFSTPIKYKYIYRCASICASADATGAARCFYPDRETDREEGRDCVWLQGWNFWHQAATWYAGRGVSPQFTHNCSILIVLEIYFYLCGFSFFFVCFFPPVFLWSSVYVCAPVTDGKIHWLEVGGWGGGTQEKMEYGKHKCNLCFKERRSRLGTLH